MADKATVDKLRKQALTLRKDLLALSRQQSIHIGGDLSAADFMTVIWQYAMEYDVKNPRWDGRDRFILSKGHAAAVTSFAQAERGAYEKDEIYKEYATDFGRFGMHSCNLINPYVDVSTGSLGHGLPVGNGIAQGLRMNGNSKSRVYIVLGDGELDEGSVWEGALLTGALKLGNIVAFIDRNKLQLDSHTEDMVPLEPLADKWRSFNFNVIEVNGHDIAALVDVIDNLPAPDSDVPTMIICDTIKGKGVSFMEDAVAFHMTELCDEDYDKAIAEIEAAYERGE